ncbi:MAG: hypothetical protein QME46_00200 [Thermoanaerobacteraceae bacterium]|nr:hypothetical protein [Thermoanaerobacteraceae bacterium]
MKRFFFLLIAVISVYYLFSGMNSGSSEAMSLKAQISYKSYTDFIPDINGYWGYRAGEVLHYAEDGINDFAIKVNAAKPVLSSGDLLVVYDAGGDVLYGYDKHGKELWEYKAAGSIEDVVLKPGDNILMLYLKDKMFYINELNNEGKKLGEWVASNDFVMDYDFKGDIAYVASANTSDSIGGRITAYTKKGDLLWAQELPGFMPLKISASDEGVSAILDKKVMAVSSNGKVLFEKEMAAEYGCIGEDGTMYVGSGGSLQGLAIDGRELFSIRTPGIDSVYPMDKGAVVLSGRSITYYDSRGKATASFDAMRDLDYLVPMEGKRRILAVGRSGADLIELPSRVLK